MIWGYLGAVGFIMFVGIVCFMIGYEMGRRHW